MFDDSDWEKYADIIDMPHHVSKKHKQMSAHERAAQFASFAALKGYDEMVKETAVDNEKKMADDIQAE